MKPHVTTFQIGKNGLTEGAIQSIKQDLKYHRQVRISVLRSFCRNRDELKKLAEEIEKSLPYKLRVRTIGYTIILVKIGKTGRK